ncbi:unnamed protein product [Discula destructiva]
MAIQQLRNTAFSEAWTTNHWKALILGPLLLTCLWLGVLSKPLLFNNLNLYHDHQLLQKQQQQQQQQLQHQQLPPGLESITAPPFTDQTKQPKDSVTGGPTDRPLVLFAYAESDNARANLIFFLVRGLHARADFIFIFNGETDATELVPKDLDNVRVVTRNNTCYDIGAFGEVLRENGLWLKYKRFITLNASIRGPFLPMWSDDCWTDAFLNRVTDRAKLVGLTYSCDPVPHVQSMLLATDVVGMRILMDPDLAYSVPADTPPWGGPELPTGFSQCYNSYAHAVHAEIGMARLIRSQGYVVDVMLTSVHSSNAEVYCNPERAGHQDDHLKPNAYFGSNVHPYEIMFAKANRGIDDNLLTLFTDWHYQMNETSWDKCAKRRPL